MPPSPHAPVPEPDGPPSGWVLRHLRPLFMAPVAALALAGVLLTLAQVHDRFEAGIADRLMGVRTAVEDVAPDPLTPAVHTLGAAADLLAADPALTARLAAGDRAGLLARAVPLLAVLRTRHGINGLTFAGPDGTVLARAHDPGRHGDRLSHFTALRALATGAPAFGLEAAAPGVVSLRYVTPWGSAPSGAGTAPGAAPAAPIGYLELDLALDALLPPIADAAGVPVFVLLQKDVVDRGAWEDYERSRGTEPRWNDFRALVPYTTGPAPAPEGLARALEAAPSGPHGRGGLVLDGGRTRAAVAHLVDASGRHLGYVAGLLDVSERLAAARRAARLGIALGLACAGLLLALAATLAGRLGRRLARDARTIDDLTTRDPLTGLFNHRAFYGFLEQELHRAARLDQPVAVLMIDVDRFREVNDRHGHRAGDRVLACIAGVVRTSVRRIDPVCRYGGVQFAVILPHTGPAAARRAAERLRERVARAPCEVSPHAVTHVTVSVGIAAHPPEEADPEALVRAADDALYAAKAAGRDRVVEAPHPAEGHVPAGAV
jgi:diguanylate cyclase (GGDEF)-like protein